MNKPCYSNWKDTTSYSQSDKEKKPTTWTVKNGPLQITVTCGHNHYKPDWVMHCRELGIDTKHIGAFDTPYEAKQCAITVVGEYITRLACALERITADE